MKSCLANESPLTSQTFTIAISRNLPMKKVDSTKGKAPKPSAITTTKDLRNNKAKIREGGTCTGYS